MRESRGDKSALTYDREIDGSSEERGEEEEVKSGECGRGDSWMSVVVNNNPWQQLNARWKRLQAQRMKCRCAGSPK